MHSKEKLTKKKFAKKSQGKEDIDAFGDEAIKKAAGTRGNARPLTQDYSDIVMAPETEEEDDEADGTADTTTSSIAWLRSGHMIEELLFRENWIGILFFQIF
jgi:hypothetical protein